MTVMRAQPVSGGMARAVIVLILALLLPPTTANAFCGFFVSGADAKLTNDASMVVLVREGTRTVLAMQNDYAGPPEDFALVVPVPVVLQKENVKTLERLAFDRVDSIAAPRLVEYWEQDPCREEPQGETGDNSREGGTGTRAKGESGSMGNRFGSSVTIEAKFAVGEYEVIVLGAKDSAGLDGWLREEHYKIPVGAEPVLRPYVAAGSKFFVAKVDVKKVRFENGRLRLSPLRFHYDAETFTLPVRLGLLNSPGTQDLIVHILASTRYEVANYPNVRIPTNIDVDDSVRVAFPAFYTSLFDKTLEKNPRAVVTEYAWQASSCDPCPVDPLGTSDFKLLGLDSDAVKLSSTSSNLTLTRLHARYTKEALGEDLVFRAADPIEGGREGDASSSAPPTTLAKAAANNFQSRYVIRHRWKGPIRCADPSRDDWGGPSDGQRSRDPASAKDLATTPRHGPRELHEVVRTDIPSLGVKADRTNELSPHSRRLWPLGIGGGFGLLAIVLFLGIGRRKDVV